MTKEIIGGRSGENLPYSRAVRAGDFIYVSGMVAFDDNGEIVEGGVGAETRAILEELTELLADANCTLDQVVKVNICLPNPENFDAFNAVYSEYFKKEHPARATICAGLTIEASIEIESIVYAPV